MEQANARRKHRQQRKSSKGQMESISAIYFGEDRYLRVVNQPKANPGFVSTISNTATNFRLAEKFGNIGLIAHNYLGGRHFHEVEVGDQIHVMDGHGQRRTYRVKELICYQAVSPNSVRSNFIDLEDNKLYTATDVFKRVYKGKHLLVLQTCIKKGRNEEWGRKFVIAFPEKR